jgi:hypothetical protein
MRVLPYWPDSQHLQQDAGNRQNQDMLLTPRRASGGWRLHSGVWVRPRRLSRKRFR